MARFILTILCSLFLLQSYSQSFEGKIHFVKKSLNDTIFYNYLVKDNMMRVDELDSSGKVVHSLLIDLENKEMTAIHPARKMYMPFPVNPWA